MSEDRYPCPCCGYQTYIVPAGGSRQLCPVCFWEDLPLEERIGLWDGITLVTAQENFLNLGISEKKYREAVRAPLPEETRSPGRLSFSELRLKVVMMIEDAFGDIRREDGVTLRQMEIVSRYGSESELEKAGLMDPEMRWQEISSEKLSAFRMHLLYLGPKGFHFYLPAFMRHVLLKLGSGRSYEDCGTIFFLRWNHKIEYQEECFNQLDSGEKECVASFLHTFAVVASDIHPPAAHDARVALKSGWDRWLPEFLKLGSA